MHFPTVDKLSIDFFVCSYIYIYFVGIYLFHYCLFLQSFINNLAWHRVFSLILRVSRIFSETTRRIWEKN